LFPSLQVDLKEDCYKSLICISYDISFQPYLPFFYWVGIGDIFFTPRVFSSLERERREEKRREGEVTREEKETLI